LGKKYGEISSVSIVGTNYVVLNSYKAINAILEKQSIKCSDRPRLPFATDLVGLDKGMLYVNNNDRFRNYRRLFARLFGSRSSTATFNPIEEEETYNFLRNVLKKPEDLNKHIRRNAGTIILKVAYGYTVKEGGEDPFVELADKVMHVISLTANPGAYIVDTIPALRYLPEWFPGATFFEEAKRYRNYVNESVSKPHQWVLRQMAAGTASQSFASTLLEGVDDPEEEDIIMWASSQVYLGASDTVVSAIYAFFLAMVLYPDVQAKAQAEIDSVVGTGRLPCFNDQDSLPYVNALCKEVLRWHSVGPLAMPHVATEDIHYEGYVIPKGTFIIGNSWAVLKDDAIYPDCRVFRPERFLGPTPQPDPKLVCFGYGRRVCPGYHLAEAALFISVVMSLAALKISNSIENGVKIIPEYDVTPGAISHPTPFKCHIAPRTAQVEALLRA